MSEHLQRASALSSPPFLCRHPSNQGDLDVVVAVVCQNVCVLCVCCVCGWLPLFMKRMRQCPQGDGEDKRDGERERERREMLLLWRSC